MVARSIIQVMKSTRLVAIVLLLCGLASGQIKNKGWWQNAVFYQVYPRSFMDSDDDGIGDLKGITSKLDHFTESGITAIWLSPINQSPDRDFGYDISDFRDVHPRYGTLNDLKNLIKVAHEKRLKVILDLVPNHTSDKHFWFDMSVKQIGKYKDYYIWSDGIKNQSGGNPLPPNNWASVFNGSAWTYHPERKQLYFHQFYKEQPDLNYTNDDVKEEMKEIMRYWLDKGIDGFRIDAVPHLFESNITQNEPTIIVPGANLTDHVSFNHTLTKDQPDTYKLVKSWRDFVDKYAEQNQRDEIVLMTEAYTSLENTIKYYDFGAHIPFNFKFITDVNATSTASDFVRVINNWVTKKPKDAVSNWVMGNHDRVRAPTRYPGRPDQMTMLAMILPGVAVTYYGEEIGMEDKPNLATFDFRDGCRTPFQWDSSLNAGFSNGSKTWLPVHENYKELNLEKQKKDTPSHYDLYKKLVQLRKSDTLKHGSLQTTAINNVLVVTRSANEKSVTLLINFSNNDSVVLNTDLSKFLRTTDGKIHLSSVGSKLTANASVKLSNFVLPAKASVVLLTSGADLASYSILTLLLLTLTALFRS